MVMKQKYIPILLLLFFSLPGYWSRALAQKDTTNLNQNVEVMKAYKPSVSNASKIDLLPELNDTTRFRPDLNYATSSHPVTGGFKPSTLTAYNLVHQEISYPGYGKIRAGFGTYNTPFLDFYLNNPNSVNGTLGLQLNYLSSMGAIRLNGGDKVEAPFSSSKALLFGSYVYEGITLSSSFDYQRDMNRFYGYPIAIPASLATDDFARYFNQDQLHQKGSFGLSVKSNATAISSLKFNTGIRLGYFNTATDQTEKESTIAGDFDYNLGTFHAKLSAGFSHFETSNITDIPDLPASKSIKNNWLQLIPSISYQNEYFAFEGGINLQSNSDSNVGSTLKIYPRAIISVHAADNKIGLYAGVDGYLQNNHYAVIAAENRWINPILNVFPTNHMNIFSGGIKGKIVNPLAFDFGVKYGKAENQYFYTTRIENRTAKITPDLTDLTYNNAFEVVYDNLTTLDFSGELTYSTPTLFLLLSGHFYNYELNWLEKAPYRPDFTLYINSKINITEQITASAELDLTGPRNVQLSYRLPIWSSVATPAPIYLSTASMTQLNLGVNYHYSKKLDFLARVENLLNAKDEPWYGYTVQGIRFKVGASFSF